MSYSFSGKLWRYAAENAAWFFVTIGGDLAKEVKLAAGKRRGWGQVKVEVTIGKTIWQTSIFPDKRRGYVLPIKASVRKSEGIEEEDVVKGVFKIKNM